MHAHPQPSPALDLIGVEMEQVEQLLAEATAGVEEPLRSMLQCVLAGGKRLRPALVILVVRMFAVPDAQACRLGAAVETLHAATLVHDDMVDKSLLRRGRKTLHSTWSSGASVLAGDYLLAHSMGLLASLGLPRLLEVVAAALRALRGRSQAGVRRRCWLGPGGVLQQHPVQDGSALCCCRRIGRHPCRCD